MSKFKELFKFDKGCSTQTKHSIRTSGPPCRQKQRSVSQTKREIVQKELNDMLSLGVICKSRSAYSSPVVLVKKPDNKRRFCVDYRELNSITKSDNYPVPGVQERLSGLKGAKYFIKLDLFAGYWQILITEEDIPKTTFIANGQLYEFIVMPFGLETAPATFQRMMDEVLEGLIDKGVLVYLDDVLIYEDNIELLYKRLETVLQRLKVSNLHIRD